MPPSTGSNTGAGTPLTAEEERLRVEPGHNHTTTGLPTYPVCRGACPLGCDKPLAPTEQIEVRPGEFLPRPRMFVMDPISEGEAGLAVSLANDQGETSAARPATDPAGLDVLRERIASLRQSVRFTDRKTGADVTTDDIATRLSVATLPVHREEPSL